MVIAVDATRLADGIPSVGLRLVQLRRPDPRCFSRHGTHGLHRRLRYTPCPSGQLRSSKHRDHWLCPCAGCAGRNPVTIDIPEARAQTSPSIRRKGNASFSVRRQSSLCGRLNRPSSTRSSLTSGGYRLTDDIGFRDIRVDGTRILLNGKANFCRALTYTPKPQFAAVAPTPMRMSARYSAT